MKLTTNIKKYRSNASGTYALFGLISTSNVHWLRTTCTTTFKLITFFCDIFKGFFLLSVHTKCAKMKRTPPHILYSVNIEVWFLYPLRNHIPKHFVLISRLHKLYRCIYWVTDIYTTKSFYIFDVTIEPYTPKNTTLSVY